MSPTPTSNAVLLERIENVIKKVDSIASDVRCNASDFNKFAKEYEGSHTQVVESDKQAHARIDELKKRMDVFEEAMKELTESIHPLVFTNLAGCAPGQFDSRPHLVNPDAYRRTGNAVK